MEFESLRAYYLDYWVPAMRELLGWSEERTLAWAQRYDDDLDERGNVWFYHDPPSSYLVNLLVPETIPEYMHHVYTAVAEALHKGDPTSEADWSAIKSEIEDALNDHGRAFRASPRCRRSISPDEKGADRNGDDQEFPEKSPVFARRKGPMEHSGVHSPDAGQEKGTSLILTTRRGGGSAVTCRY